MSVSISIDITDAQAEMLRADLPTLPKFSATRALVAELLATIDESRD